MLAEVEAEVVVRLVMVWSMSLGYHHPMRLSHSGVHASGSVTVA